MSRRAELISPEGIFDEGDIMDTILMIILMSRAETGW